MINEPLGLLSALVAGALLGAIFFGGLWWTVGKVVSSKHPALLVFTSLLLRMTVTLTCFYFVASGHWERLLACLLGFLIARLIVRRLTGLPLERSEASAKEADHAT